VHVDGKVAVLAVAQIQHAVGLKGAFGKHKTLTRQIGEQLDRILSILSEGEEGKEKESSCLRNFE
jgi:hypothetical protein